jgi:tetratricopeptide (TPR) repeat protein
MCRFAGYFLMLAPLFCYAQGATEVTAFDDAMAKLQTGNYPAAIPQFAKVLEQYPDDYGSNMGMGIALRETAQLDSALLYLDHAIKIQPTEEAYWNRAALFYMLKENSKGDRDAQQAIGMKPASPVLYELRGYCLLLRKDYTAAIKILDSAIAGNKNTYKAYLNKAAALGYLNRHAEAVAVLDQVLELKPDYLNAWYNRAKMRIALGDLDQALSDCNKLIELDNRNADDLVLRAGVKDNLGDDAGALDDCNQAIAIDSGNAAAYNMRAIARFDAHETLEIISDCNKAIALKPDYYDPYIQRGDAYDDLGEYDKAIADYTKAISIDSAKLQAYRECAASFAHKNDYKHSLFYLERGLQIEPKNKYLLGHKFQTQRLMGNPAGAIATLNQCIKYFPDSPSVYFLQKAYIYDSLHDNLSACKFAYEAMKSGLGEGYDYIVSHPCPAYKNQPLVLAQPFMLQAKEQFDMQNYEAEIGLINKAITLLPDTPSLYYNRGIAKRKTNDFSGAIEDYSKAISLHPRYPDAIVARGVAKINLKNAEGAMKDFQLAIQVDSTNAMAYNNCAFVIVDTDVPGAIDYLTKAIHFNRNYTSAYLTRGKLYLKLGEKAEACADLRKTEALGSEDAKIERMVNCK